MKASRYNKVLGLAVGEKSIQIAEVLGGDSVEAKRLGEFVFPVGLSLADPAALGVALGEFLRAQKFACRNAVVGLPAKWLLVKTKEVPPADATIAADLLRLQAEGDFSSELKDLVFDYAGESSPSATTSVLLVATPRKYVDLAVQLCESANIEAVAITSSAAALATVTTRAGTEDAVVLTLAAGGSELTAQSGGHTSALRHLRGPTPEPLFLSELRRAVSMLPAASNGGREMILWDGATGLSTSLGDSLGMKVRDGDLPSLGVTTTEAASNGGGRKYAPAVALGVAGIGALPLPIDFLHSRLAPPKRQIVAPWHVWTAVSVILLIGIYMLMSYIQRRDQRQLDTLTATYSAQKPASDNAEKFVGKVTFARKWHANDPRYAACLNAITRLVPEDGQTYCTGLGIREKEIPKPVGNKDNAPKPSGDLPPLIVNFSAKAPSQAAAVAVKDAFLRDRGRFTDMKFNGTHNAGKNGEVTFSFTCTFVPPPKTGK